MQTKLYKAASKGILNTSLEMWTGIHQLKTCIISEFIRQKLLHPIMQMIFFCGINMFVRVCIYQQENSSFTTAILPID